MLAKIVFITNCSYSLWMFILQVEGQLEEQLFSLYHKERKIEALEETIGEKKAELASMVSMIVHTVDSVKHKYTPPC